MADGRAAPGRDVAANRELWTRVNAQYADEHAAQAWAWVRHNSVGLEAGHRV